MSHHTLTNTYIFEINEHVSCKVCDAHHARLVAETLLLLAPLAGERTCVLYYPVVEGLEPRPCVLTQRVIGLGI